MGLFLHLNTVFPHCSLYIFDFGFLCINPQLRSQGPGNEVASTLSSVSSSQPTPFSRGEDSHMKQTGMLVVSLRGVNFGCLVSPRVSRAKRQFLSHNALV